jgi:hypothetical protein
MSPDDPLASGGRLPSGTLTFLFTDIEGSTKLGVALGTDDARESVERSIERAGAAGDRYVAFFSTALRSRIHLMTGNVPAAISAYRSILESSRAVDLGIGIALGLEYFSDLAFWGGDLPRAVRLGAAAKRPKAELGGGIDPRMGGAVDALVVGRSRLAPADFEREAAAGSAMDVDTATAEALATPAPASVPAMCGPSADAPR